MQMEYQLDKQIEQYGMSLILDTNNFDLFWFRRYLNIFLYVMYF